MFLLFSDISIKIHKQDPSLTLDSFNYRYKCKSHLNINLKFNTNKTGEQLFIYAFDGKFQLLMHYFRRYYLS